MSWSIQLLGGLWEDRLGDVVAGAFQAETKETEAGGWTLECPPSGVTVDDRTDHQVGSVLLFDGGRPVFQGIVGELRKVRTAAGLMLRWSGTDSFGLLMDRAVVPNPALDDPFTRPVHRESGQASSVATAFVQQHLGQLAAGGRDSGVVVVDGGGGINGSWFGEPTERLDDLVARICREGQIGCVMSMSDDRRPSFTFAARRTVNVRLDESDLTGWESSRSKPTVTHVTGVRDVDGVREIIVRSTGATGRDRKERVISVSGEYDECVQQVAAELAAGAGQWHVTATMSAAGSARLRYLVDYRVGDIVNIQIDRTVVPLPIVGVRFESGEAGNTVTPVLGDGSSDVLSRLFARVRGLERALRRQAA